MTSCVEEVKESLMWDDDVIVTSDELKSYAANYPPMGVYIPRGKVKVPHLRTHHHQTSQSARGKPNSPNLLMIKPGHQAPLVTQTLPSIDIYANRHCGGGNGCSILPTASKRYHHTTHQEPSTKTRIMTKTNEYTPVTSQLGYSGNNVNSGMLQYAKSFVTRSDGLLPSEQPTVPPQYANGLTNKKIGTDMTSLMTHGMGYPNDPRFYHHLSALAAMAWSDCSQATEKLRRICEETAQLSRGYDPFGILSRGIPCYHPHVFPVSSATGTKRTFPRSNELHPEKVNSFTARCRQLAEDHQPFLNPAMPHSTSHAPPCGTTLKTHRAGKERMNFMTPRSPLPGIAVLNSQISASRLRQNVPFDSTNQRDIATRRNGLPPKPNISRQKRKLGESEGLFDSIAPPLEASARAKIPRYETAVPNLYQPNPLMTQSYGDMTSLFQESLRNPAPQLPPYGSVLRNDIQNAIPDLLENVVKAESRSVSHFSDVIAQNTSRDVTNQFSKFSGKLCLPSVSYSPSQACANLPFVLQ